MSETSADVLTLHPRWGQHVLRDPNMIAKMVRTVRPRKGDRFIEIGPGTGAFTKPLLEAGAGVMAIERDARLAAYLQDCLAPAYPKLKVICADALAWDFKRASPLSRARKPKTGLAPLGRRRASAKKFRLFGNLPYHITSPLIFKILSWRRWLSDVHITVQKEVAERLSSGPGSPAYGRLTLAVRFFATVEHLFDVNRHVFFPTPGVDSAFLRLTFHKKQHPAAAAVRFEQLLKCAFSERRKTLANALGSHRAFGLAKPEWEAVLERARVAPGARAEQLLIKDFLAILEAVSSLR